MLKLILIALLLFQFSFIHAQIINTVAGTGSSIDSGDDNLAYAAGIHNPSNIAFDKNGNLYIVEGPGAKIRKISNSGVITTVAGTGISGYSGDNGPATMAQLKFPIGLTVDTSGNIYFCDYQVNRIRKVDISTGIITTIAGNGFAGFAGDDGLASAAALNAPEDICCDKNGNLYIADTYNNRIRKVNNLGIISTVAGTGATTFNGDGGLADTSNLNFPVSVCIDYVGNLYISDNAHRRIRMVNSFGIINTIAGNGIFGIIGDGGLATNAELSDNANITCDATGNLYISFAYPTNRIKVVNSSNLIRTVTGNGIGAYFGDGGLDTFAEVNNPTGLVTDSCGNLFIADEYNNRIRKVSFNPSCFPTNTKENSAQQITIYPNPVTTEISIDNVKGETKYRIYSSIGNIEQTGILKVGNNRVTIKTLTKGLLLIEITDSEGMKIIKKFIKE